MNPENVTESYVHSTVRLNYQNIVFTPICGIAGNPTVGVQQHCIEIRHPQTPEGTARFATSTSTTPG